MVEAIADATPNGRVLNRRVEDNEIVAGRKLLLQVPGFIASLECHIVHPETHPDFL